MAFNVKQDNRGLSADKLIDTQAYFKKDSDDLKGDGTLNHDIYRMINNSGLNDRIYNEARKTDALLEPKKFQLNKLGAMKDYKGYIVDSLKAYKEYLKKRGYPDGIILVMMENQKNHLVRSFESDLKLEFPDVGGAIAQTVIQSGIPSNP